MSDHENPVVRTARDLFAGVRVCDVGAARTWYERFLGAAPSFFPNDVEAVWALADQRWLYVLEDAGGAGHALVTVMVADLDETVSAIAARGIEPDGREAYDGARKVIYHDPDGNEIGVGQIPPES